MAEEEAAEKTEEKSEAEEKPENAVKERPRIHTLDEVRGFAIFCMIFFHAFYSIGVFFNAKWGMDLLMFFMPAEPYFAGLFIAMSGLACNLSHSNLERGVKLGIIALGVTLVTYIMDEISGDGYLISFGILHMLAVGMLVYGLINKYLKLIPSWIGMLLNTVLFFFTYNIARGSVGIPYLFTIKLPEEWYTTKFLFAFGLPDKTFASSDYFPIIPWIFLFIAGTYLGRIAVKKKFPRFMFKKRIPLFAFMGRHSLLIYLVHQPVIFALCYLAGGVMDFFTKS